MKEESNQTKKQIYQSEQALKAMVKSKKKKNGQTEL